MQEDNDVTVSLSSSVCAQGTAIVRAQQSHACSWDFRPVSVPRKTLCNRARWSKCPGRGHGVSLCLAGFVSVVISGDAGDDRV